MTNKSKNHFGKQEKLVRKESHGKQHQPEAFKNNRNARLEAILNATGTCRCGDGPACSGDGRLKRFTARAVDDWIERGMRKHHHGEKQ